MNWDTLSRKTLLEIKLGVDKPYPYVKITLQLYKEYSKLQFDINRIKPSPQAESICPCCKSKVIAKCGSVKIWHWAHESLENCDANWEPITQWHLDWQSKVPEEMQEVIIGKHIADVKLSTGKVIEIQHSNIPSEVVKEREEFYGNITWIFDGSEFADRIKFREKESKYGNTYYTFKFKHPRQYIICSTKFPLYIDFGDFVFKVKGFNSYQNHSDAYDKDYTTWVGWGNKMDKDMFLYREIFGKDYNGR